MGAGFCSLYREIHYIEVRYIKVWVYFNCILKKKGSGSNLTSNTTPDIVLLCSDCVESWDHNKKNLDASPLRSKENR